MKFLANENVPRLAVEALQKDGHDVAWVRLERPGITDREVLAWAMSEDRILLTLDKDFGELAFRAELPATCGVLLVRVQPPVPADVAATVLRLVRTSADLQGEFIVLESDRVRRRRLPGSQSGDAQ